MHNNCAQSVQNLWIAVRKTCVRLSTIYGQVLRLTHTPRVQVVFIHRLFRVSPLSLSTNKYTFSPLYFGHLYPQSTAPTINPTK
jgi:hypothetical protein